MGGGCEIKPKGKEYLCIEGKKVLWRSLPSLCMFGEKCGKGKGVNSAIMSTEKENKSVPLFRIYEGVLSKVVGFLVFLQNTLLLYIIILCLRYTLYSVLFQF